MKKRILIVDDDIDLCEELAFALTDEGFSVKKAFNGSDGRKMALAGREDVLILDVGLPQVSGLKILEEVKKKRKNLKVILITGNMIILDKAITKECIDDDVCEVLKLADAVIGKPIDMFSLLKIIKEWN